MSSSTAPSILSVLWESYDSAVPSTLFEKLYRRTVLRRSVLYPPGSLDIAKKSILKHISNLDKFCK